MKYLSSASSSLSAIQLATTLATIVGAFFVDFSLQYAIITVLSFYAYSIIGISLTLHRYYSHKSFEFKYDWIRKLCTFIALLSARGSPLGWVYVHRIHHSKSDTVEDPHSPNTIGFKLFAFKHIINDSEKMKLFLVKDLINKEQLFLNNYYIGFIFLWAIFLTLISPDALYFTYIVPITLVQISQSLFNYFAHKSGYRNFETKDQSTNNIWLWILIFGDAWHNNHHSNAAKLSTKIKWWEFDPIKSIVGVVGK